MTNALPVELRAKSQYVFRPMGVEPITLGFPIALLLYVSLRCFGTSQPMSTRHAQLAANPWCIVLLTMTSQMTCSSINYSDEIGRRGGSCNHGHPLIGRWIKTWTWISCDMHSCFELSNEGGCSYCWATLLLKSGRVIRWSHHIEICLRRNPAEKSCTWCIHATSTHNSLQVTTNKLSSGFLGRLKMN